MRVCRHELEELKPPTPGNSNPVNC